MVDGSLDRGMYEAFGLAGLAWSNTSVFQQVICGIPATDAVVDTEIE